jgi:transcription antitermination factor NusA-like protein
MILPLRVSDIKEEDGVITLTGPDSQTKGLLIGRSAANLRLLEKNVKRYFDIKEIKVV